MQAPFAEDDRLIDRPIALLALEPAELTSKLGIRFEEGEDDLDRLQAAAIKAKDGRRFVLIRHEHQPRPGTEIRTRFDSSDLTGDLAAVLRTLGLPWSSVLWWHPDISIDDLCHELRDIGARRHS